MTNHSLNIYDENLRFASVAIALCVDYFLFFSYSKGWKWFHQSINQSIKFLQRQYPLQSQTQWHDSQIGIQQQNWWISSVTSTGRWVCSCLRGKGHFKEMCLLDYCNSLLYGIADSDLTKLQRIQNRLSCIVTKSPPFTRSVPLLRSLHWLPVNFRQLFKISLLTHKALNKNQPAYLDSMRDPSLPFRSLRSNNGIGLSVPRVKTSPGARAFYSCGPSVRNNMPLSVRSAISVATFKKHLKTHLFDLAAPP